MANAWPPWAVKARASRGRNRGRPGRGAGPVRAENRTHSSDQRSCSLGSSPMMINDHVPSIDVPPDQGTSRVAAAVPA